MPTDNEDLEKIQEYISLLRLGKFTSEQEKAEKILILLDSIIAADRWKNASEVLDQLGNVAETVKSVMPLETTPRNIMKRVQKIVIDEYNTCVNRSMDTITYDPTHELLFGNPSSDGLPECSKDAPDLVHNLHEALEEYKSEIEQSQELIAAQGETKIHNDEVIMTCGFCPMVCAFLTKAKKKRKFLVIVAECAPTYDGHRMAKVLNDAGIETMLIQDAAVFSLMARVNKVIVGTWTVMKNGGIKAFVGATSLAAAAKFYSVPLYVCAPTYKFSTESVEDLNEYASPASLIPAGCQMSPELNVSVAKLDYVPPENVTSFITNNGGIAPSYVYRQLIELYEPAAHDV